MADPHERRPEDGAPDQSLPAAYFERLYAESPDPWRFTTSPYEAAKYARTLAALPRALYPSALEVGCSIGVLTRRLAARCGHLLSVDVSEAALAQARVRCAGLPNVTFERCVLPQEFPPGTFSLIVLSEVGYYFSERDLERVIDECAGALEPGGHLLLVHWTGETPYPLTGDRVHEAFLARAETDGWALWRPLHAERHSEYRLDLLERMRQAYARVPQAALGLL